ncbi:hypothetical protein [Planctomycetes bacterium TBK1r]|uniref:PEP-CTERM protein-sorting domain-containing protein n=1 Tax=Stieleria magnilauensis TaxID=2527963 RepID=A0ABX5XSI1_9BACT|nr:hypothetical protein TBK1r_39050 [Planctomycetes bacterium TBK1r]
MFNRSILRYSALALLFATAFNVDRLDAGVIYDEAVDGDLPTGSFFDLGVLSVGTNTILGNNSGSDFDDFKFEIASGTQLASGTFTFLEDSLSFMRFQVPDGGFYLNLNRGAATGTVSFNLSDTARSLASPFPLIDPTPLPAGSYEWDNDGKSGGGDYRIDFVVQSTSGSPPGVVPEPSSFMLWGCAAFLGLARNRRRRD